MGAAEIELVVNGSGSVRDEAVAELRKTLLDDGAASRVREIKVQRPETGTRPADVVAVAALAVATVGTATQVVDLVRAWLAGRKGDGVPSVTVTIEADSVEIIEPATATEEKRIEEFTRRHDEES